MGRAWIRTMHATRAACTLRLHCTGARETTGFLSIFELKYTQNPKPNTCIKHTHTHTYSHTPTNIIQTQVVLTKAFAWRTTLLTWRANRFLTLRAEYGQICGPNLHSFPWNHIDCLRISTCRPCARQQWRRSPKSTHLSSGAFSEHNPMHLRRSLAPRVPFNDGLRRCEQFSYL